MIASIRGEVLAIVDNAVIIDVGGVGISTLVVERTLQTLSIGSKATLHTSLMVREDSLTLFGFEDTQERDLFVLLQTVTGIGPRVAQSILNTLTVSDLRNAIGSESAAALEKVSGLGKKGAARIILELKDKVLGVNQRIVGGNNGGGGWQSSISAALSGLGFTGREIDQAISSVAVTARDQPLEEKLRVALLNLQSPQSRGGTRG
ncbi:MAG: Holliday junction branch migration protein RuvA [Candidatus Nanopelagicaceae bacterium]|nr:Holliday junction branch migration protein RuvA [Candidatus Nanopelagicaceae bacterium]